MANTYFDFRKFRVNQEQTAMKVTTDSCLFGAWVAEEVKNNGSEKLLDIGTGTGLLAMMIFQKNPLLEIDAIEIDPDAATQARQNISGSPWPGKISVINADVRDYEFKTQYDLITSNPPFYETELKGKKPGRNLAHHEGLAISELISETRKLLQPGGQFFFLLPYKRNSEIKKLFLHADCTISKLVMVRQSPFHDYFRIMIKGTCKKADLAETEIAEISIKGLNNKYSPGFIELLEEYYLQF